MRLSVFLKIFFSSLVFIILSLIFALGFIVFACQVPPKYLLFREGTPQEIIQAIFFFIVNFKTEAAIIFFILILLCLLTSILLVQSLRQPIKRVIKGVQEAAKGNFDFKVEIISKDELGELAKNFNNMVQQLKQTRAASEETKAALEIKLLARTKELEELAESREDIIEKRTKELLERLEELEKFHRLAVGRELKMIELKKELKELKARVKKQKLWKKK